jgi:hypothetical protein
MKGGKLPRRPNGSRKTKSKPPNKHYERRKEQNAMRTWIKVAAITLAVAVPAFFLGPILFPPADIGVEPTAGQMPLFLFLAVGDALLLGLGISFLLFGLSIMRRVSPDSRLRAWAMYLSIGYLMTSWWLHLNLHAYNGFDLQGLLLIDYFFHLPLEVAAVVLAISFVSLVRSRMGETTAQVE